MATRLIGNDLKGFAVTAHLDQNPKEDTIQQFIQSTKKCILKVEGKQILASEYFLRRCPLLYEKVERSAGGEIELDEFSFAAYQAFITYLHTDLLEIEDAYLKEALQLSHAYKMGGFGSQVVLHIRWRFTLDNVLEYYVAAVEDHDKELGLAAVEFIKGRIDAFLRDGDIEKCNTLIVGLLWKDLRQVGAFNAAANDSSIVVSSVGDEDDQEEIVEDLSGSDTPVVHEYQMEQIRRRYNPIRRSLS